MAFEKLEGISEFPIEFETLGSLFIGGGDQPQSTYDTPIVRVGGQPVIPGSSLKGALRSNIEAILTARGVQVCVPYTTIPEDIRRERRQDDYLRRIGRLAPCNPASVTPCPACELFGTAGGRVGLSGRVVVLDARIPNYDPSMLSERTHVAIARDTRAQAGGALVHVEVVDAGVHFRGRIRVINRQDWHLGALLRGLETLADLGVGAKKTSGYGQLRITPGGISVRRLTADGWQRTEVNADTCRQAFDRKTWPRR